MHKVVCDRFLGQDGSLRRNTSVANPNPAVTEMAKSRLRYHRISALIAGTISIFNTLGQPAKTKEKQYRGDRLDDELRQREIRRKTTNEAHTSGNQIRAAKQNEGRETMEFGWYAAWECAGDAHHPEQRECKIELRVYGTRLWLTPLLAAIVPIYERGLARGGSGHTQFDFAFALFWMVGITCALGAAYQAKFHRLAALILLGGTGLVTCISFVWLSAPDLALTQLIVETVTTVLLLLGLRWLPKRVEDADRAGDQGMIRWYRGRDFAISVAVGLGLAALAYAVMIRPAPETIAHYFVENAYTLGGGKNIVNVILVDFRGFDTFGEITVLGVVALTVYALLRRFRPAAESIPVPEQQRAQNIDDAKQPGREKGDTVKSAMAIPSLIMTALVSGDRDFGALPVAART